MMRLLILLLGMSIGMGSIFLLMMLPGSKNDLWFTIYDELFIYSV